MQPEGSLPCLGKKFAFSFLIKQTMYLKFSRATKSIYRTSIPFNLNDNLFAFVVIVFVGS
jgi:hypothetical protein